MAGRRIEYFLTASSPWTYLGHTEFGRIAARHGAAIILRPTPIRRLFDETGGLPLPKRHPVRQAYRLMDLQRWRAARNLPLDLSPAHPLADPEPLDRMATALAGMPDADAMAFLARVMAGVWGEGRDLGDPATVDAILSGLGFDPATVRRQTDTADIAAAYEANLDAARAAGIFGAPSYVLDGEVFWGQDRLAQLDDALASGRKPFHA